MANDNAKANDKMFLQVKCKPASEPVSKLVSKLVSKPAKIIHLSDE